MLHLDFIPRSAINADGAQTPLATMVRVYQLKDRKTVGAADYPTLLRKSDTVLKEDVLVSRELLVMPNGSVTLNMPMDEDAQFMAVVGLFASAGGKPKAQCEALEMDATLQEIDRLNQQLQQLDIAAEQAQTLKAAVDSQIQMFAQRLKPLNEALLMSAPEEMALTSREHLQLATAKVTGGIIV